MIIRCYKLKAEKMTEYTHPANRVADYEDVEALKKRSEEHEEAVKELKEVGIWEELEKSGIIGGTKIA